MRAASSGLRHPASASCLGRHSHLAGRCPNNSSLFPPLAAVVVVAAERLFLFVVSKRLRAFRNYFFTGGVVEGNGSCRAAFRESAARREAPLPSSPAAMPPSPRGRLFAVAGNFAAAPKGAPLGELAKPQALTEGGKPQKKKPLHKSCAMVSLVTVSNSQSRIRRAPELPSQLRRRGERRS